MEDARSWDHPDVDAEKLAGLAPDVPEPAGWALLPLRMAVALPVSGAPDRPDAVRFEAQSSSDAAVVVPLAVQESSVRTLAALARQVPLEVERVARQPVSMAEAQSALQPSAEWPPEVLPLLELEVPAFVPGAEAQAR
jgi:hypothetical protein